MLRALATALTLAAFARAGALPPQEDVDWGDRQTPAVVWKYLHYKHPNIEKAWPKLEPFEKQRLANVALQQGTQRVENARKAHDALLTLCGPAAASFRESDGSYKRERDPAHTSCNLKIASSIPDARIAESAYWLSPEEGRELWELRQEALRLMAHVEEGRLSRQDLAWSKAHFHPQIQLALEQAQKAQDRGREGRAFMARARAALLPDGFDAKAAGAQLKQSSWDESSAKRLFEGSMLRAGAAPPLSIALPLDPKEAAAPPDKVRAAIWDRRSLPPALKEEILAAGLDTPEEKEFSARWSRGMRARLEAKPSGRQLLEDLGGDLPPTRIRVLGNPRTLAVADPFTSMVSFNSTHIAGEILHHDPGLKTVANDPKELEKLLVSRPDLMEKVLDGAEPVMVHEAVHVRQFRQYPRQVYRGVPQDDTVDQEQQAFVFQSRYMLEGLRAKRGFLSSASPLTEINRGDFVEYYTRPDDFLHDIDATRYHGQPTAAELAKRHQENAAKPAPVPLKPEEANGRAAGTLLLGDMAQGYGGYLKKARESWKGEAVEGRLLLARDQAERDPLFTLGQTAALKAEQPAARAEERKAAAARAATAYDAKIRAALKAEAPAGRKARDYFDYEAALQGNGYRAPDATEAQARAAVRAELDAILAGGRRRLDAGQDADPAWLETGLVDARFLGDEKAERELRALIERARAKAAKK